MLFQLDLDFLNHDGRFVVGIVIYSLVTVLFEGLIHMKLSQVYLG